MEMSARKQRDIAWAHDHLRPNEVRWLLEAHCTQDQGIWDADAFRTDVERCIAGEPLAYITKRWDFMGRPFYIDARVLIPRPDTEAWLDQLLSFHAKDKKWSVLDCGTGSGVLAITMAHMRPDWSISALDVSEKALEVAQINGKNHAVDVHWFQSHWWDKVSDRYDLIVSNPPYIESSDDCLNALSYEPLVALVSGDTGLDDLMHLIEGAPLYLKYQGWLWLEHGFDQGHTVMHLLQKRGFVEVKPCFDLANRHRATYAQWQGA